MSTLKPGSPTSWQDCLTIQESGTTNYGPGTGSCNSSLKQRQHNAPSEKIEPFTRGVKRMHTKRAHRLVEMSERGPLCVYLNYCGAHTGRWAGKDKLNFQNLPKTGGIRECIHAPP